MVKFGRLIAAQRRPEFQQYLQFSHPHRQYVDYDNLKNLIKEVRERCMKELDESVKAREEMEEIRRIASKSEERACIQMQETIIGKIQQKFFVNMEVQIKKVDEFVSQLNENLA